MDQTRFDDLTRRLGAGATRRAGLRAALGGLLGIATLAPAGDGEAKKKKKRGSNCRSGYGQSCRVSECCDCCFGGQCVDGTCCQPFGRSCVRDEDCCSGPDIACREGYCLTSDHE